MKKRLSLCIMTLSLAATVQAAERQVLLETPLNENSCVLIDGDSLHEDAEIDYFTTECPGISGYRILHNGGDLRSKITVLKDKVESTLRLPVTTSEAITFAYVNSPTIRWSITVKDNKSFRVNALSFMMSGQDESGSDYKDVSFTVIAKVAGPKVCVVGKVRVDSPTAPAEVSEILSKVSTLKCL